VAGTPRWLTHPGPERRAQKHDIAEEGKQYWLAGKGLGKWAFSDDPWTELHKHLLKFMPPGEATLTASRWFIEHFGFAAGSDLNRVTHGHPPRGHKVGPG
jgi:hypothetical protein